MTPIQRRTDDLNWMSLEGKTLDEIYVLGQCLGADEHKVVFKAQTKTGDPKTAVIKIYRAISDTSDEQIALWEWIRQVQHPNLTGISGVGRTQMGEQDLIYVAVEAADEKLDRILRERPLDAAEARELVASICRGLERLHEAGLVHGALSPEHVFGVDDAIKLSADGARPVGSEPRIGHEDGKYLAPESTNGNATPEADVWCLGATLYEAMTQKACAADCRSEAAKLPAPFSTIVHRCLYSSPEARCTLSDVVQLCEARQHAFAAAAGAGAGVGVVAEGAQNERLEASPRDVDESRYFVPRTASAAAQETRQFARRSASARRRQWYTWAFLAAALVIVAVLIWLARPRKSGASATAPSVTKSAPKQSPAAPTQTPTSAVSVPAAPPSTSAQRSNSPQALSSVHSKPAQPERPGSAETEARFVNGPIWRVVTYTYDSSADAENRANAINKRHPELKAGVFAPNGNAGPYLVVIGGEMDRESAITLRQRALRSGLPRDCYLQNYKQ